MVTLHFNGPTSYIPSEIYVEVTGLRKSPQNVVLLWTMLCLSAVWSLISGTMVTLHFNGLTSYIPSQIHVEVTGLRKSPQNVVLL